MIDVIQMTLATLRRLGYIETVEKSSQGDLGDLSSCGVIRLGSEWLR